ncbi:uncharacterized protein LOC126780955 isoform X1 [Nymphalis io]|uniref:uncharacterized protein LOC126780955 isoform X1 n=1 Tax=Inachis io TaxID=171585 RepID=UPI0021687382|nr:uncharacterized protein LOC126780955 isoform X1 [Nymphalis io]
MASQISMGTIEKLIGRENYQSWKFAVKNYLEHEELWQEIESDPGYVSDSKKNTKAKSKIILLVDPVNYVHVQEATTAKQVWTKLEKVFDDSGLSRKVSLLRDLITTDLDNCSSVEEYVNKLLLHWMEVAGMLIPEHHCICAITRIGCMMYPHQLSTILRLQTIKQ